MSLLKDFEQQILSATKLIESGVPSVSIAVLDNGTISNHVTTMGSENTKTVYQACSISKAITALAIAKLVDDGHLTYETKIIDHLPNGISECILQPKSMPLLQHVTVAMLLSHTSGLSQSGFAGYPGDLPTVEQNLRGDKAANTVRMRFLSYPGAQLSYSGGGTVLLQLVMEQICQKPFPEVMHELVLQPLGMTRSWYGDLPKDETNYAEPYLTGFHKAPTGVHRFVELAAAALWSTPSDLLKAIAATQKSLLSDGGFLKQPTAQKMLTKAASNQGLRSFGLGWAVSDYIFAHAGGNDPGYRCYAFGFHNKAPKELHNSGIAVMTSSALGVETLQAVIDALLYMMDYPKLESLPSLEFGHHIPYPAPDGTKVDVAWKDWAGQWGDGWTLLEVDGGPALKFGDFNSTPLRAAASVCLKLQNGKREVALVAADFAQLALRLTYSGEEQIIELLQREAKTLKRSTTLSTRIET